MLKIQFVEVFLRGIPEMLLILGGVGVVARKLINRNVYIFFSIIMGIIIYFIRLLPIHFGVHTFIISVLIICIMSLIGIPILESIYGTILMILILNFSELLNLLILKLLNIDTDTAFLDPIIKSALGIPSLIMTLLFIMTIRYYIKRKERVKNMNS